MNSSPFLSLLKQDHAIATQIHAVQMAAYRQEAALLGIKDFPPLRVSVADIQQSSEHFYGSYAMNELIGVISLAKEPHSDVLHISSLVVKPSAQRRHVGSGLLADVLSHFNPAHFAVTTAAKNEPAISLYRLFGFVETKRWLVSPENIELVELNKWGCNPLQELG